MKSKHFFSRETKNVHLSIEIQELLGHYVLKKKKKCISELDSAEPTVRDLCRGSCWGLKHRRKAFGGSILEQRGTW